MQAVGFGQASLWGTWQTDFGLADCIDVRAMVAGAPEQWSVLAVADVCGMWPSTCEALRQAVGQEVGTDPSKVGVFCTQNHGAPMEGPDEYDLDKWQTAFRRAAASACRRALPAQMARVDLDPAPAGVFNRRAPLEGFGSFTFYYGFESLPGDVVGCSRLLEVALLGLASGQEYAIRCAPVATEAWDKPVGDLPPVASGRVLDGPVDAAIQALFFRTPDGEPIGSLARWAAHPVTANVPGQRHSGDYPAYVRRSLSRRFGGGAVFLTGPCGNQAPLVSRKSHVLAEATGNHVATLLMDGLASASWASLDEAVSVTQQVTLPLRRDYPASAAAARKVLERARASFHATRDLRERKRLSEEIERLGYTVNDTHYSWCGIRPQDLLGVVSHPLFGLRLNDAIIAGLPGEPFGHYSLRLREGHPERFVLIAEECNGYLSYIPPAHEYELGGYGSAAAILDPSAEEVLVQAGDNLIRAVLD